MYKVIVFIPRESKELVKSAMFASGAGRMGNYDCCCFEQIGTGQFRALEGSNPHLGEQDKMEYVQEVRMETVVADKDISAVIKAMKEAHPYETPAYDVIKLEQF